MPDKKTIDQAHFVFTTGKLIQDRVFQIQSKHLAGMGNNGRFGDLSMAQINVLMLIRRLEEVSLTQLADRLGVSPPSASAMVDRLVDKALLTREPSEEDRRRVVIRISPEALKEIQEIETVVFQSFVELVDRIGPKCATQWCEVLDTVRTVIMEDQ